MWHVFRALLFLIFVFNTGGASFCSWYTESFPCQKNEFSCFNRQKCILRESHCNGVNNCGDNSDEYYCSTNISCPSTLTRCPSTRKCIPKEWICDGHIDCPYRDDESKCQNFIDTKTVTPVPITEQSRTAIHKVDSWISQERSAVSPAEKWGFSVDRLALILYFANITVPENYKTEVTYELNIQLLTRLSSMKLEDIPSTELASYVNAFLAMCINPRDFHGYNIIQELKNRIEKEKYTNPYVFLALCNAGETLTETDKNKLVETFEEEHRTFWTGMQAVFVMALSCASKQPGNEADSETLREMTAKLMEQQFRNGSIINLSTTALVMQALISTNFEFDHDHFDEMNAIKEILRNQKTDGSFGDIMNTFLVTPVLNCKSLADIKSDHCHYGETDEMAALEKLSRRIGSKIRVRYSLWIGNEKDLERNLVLRVPHNTTLYEVMEIAADIDSKFKFDYSVKNRKPYINAISGIKNDPLTEKFWFLYIVQDGEAKLSNASPADILPKDNDHYVMWYRRGTWAH